MTEPVVGVGERLIRWAGLAVAVLAGVLVAVYGVFLTPFRIGHQIVPIALVEVVAGNIAALWFAFRATESRFLALAPGLAWLVVTFSLLGDPNRGRSAKGDITLLGNGWVAPAYLLLGSLTVGVAGYLLVARQPQGNPPPS